MVDTILYLANHFLSLCLIANGAKRQLRNRLLWFIAYISDDPRLLCIIRTPHSVQRLNLILEIHLFIFFLFFRIYVKNKISHLIYTTRIGSKITVDNLLQLVSINDLQFKYIYGFAFGSHILETSIAIWYDDAKVDEFRQWAVSGCSLCVFIGNSWNHGVWMMMRHYLYQQS